MHALRFGLFRFRSPLLSKSHVVFSSSGYLDVSVHRVPFIRLCIYRMMTEVFSAGFPHSDICGSRLICSSPQLFAAYHVFRRLSVPRHPPCALVCLTCQAFFRKLSSPSVGNRLLERVHISMNYSLVILSSSELFYSGLLVSIQHSWIGTLGCLYLLMNFVTNDLFIAENFDVVRYSVFKERMSVLPDSGDKGIRTLDPLLARQVLSQLSYTPMDLATTYSPISSPT